MNKLERDIERALVGMVKRHGGLCYKFVSPGNPGVPDRIVLLPGGRVIFVETKRPRGGKVAPLQAWWSGILKKLGFRHVFIKNKTDIDLLEQFIEGVPTCRK